MNISDAASIVHRTTTACAPADCQLFNTPLWLPFLVINRVHQAWWWMRRNEIYSNPDNFLMLMSGQTINWFAGDQIFVRVVAQTMLISTRILECIEEEVIICKKAVLLWEGMIGAETLLPPRVKWAKIEGSSFFSPSTRIYLQRLRMNFCARATRIYISTLLIIKHLFFLSMRTMDAIAAFSYNAATQHEAVGEFFVNCSVWVDLLVNNKTMMIKGLENNREIISLILQQTHSPFTYEQLHNGVKGTIEVAEKVDETVEEVSDVVKMIAKDVLQRLGFGIFQPFGLAPHLPTSWIPPLRPPWIDALDAPPNERFPPANDVRLKNIKRT